MYKQMNGKYFELHYDDKVIVSTPNRAKFQTLCQQALDNNHRTFADLPYIVKAFIERSFTIIYPQA